MPIVSRKLYMPLSQLGCGPCSELAGRQVVDTSYDERTGEPVSRHPAALRAVAFARIGRDRDEAEQNLAKLWCAAGADAEPLLIDGGISGSAEIAGAECAVGVIKSHTKLYADGEALDVVMSLKAGERTSVFAPLSSSRAQVISWYLRLHDPRGHDAMHGLVRVEAAPGGDVGGRANEISRWVLAERTPNAMPDSRWDRMSYGIRDCEQFLRSIA
jgi:hypothetical protein